MSPDACSPVAAVPKGAEVPEAPPVAFRPEGGQVSCRWPDTDVSAAKAGLEGDRVSAVTSTSWNHRQAPGHPISHVPRLLKGTLPLKHSSAEPAAAGGGPFARIFACRRDVAAGSPPHTPRPGARGVARRLRRRRLRGRRRGGRSARAAPTGLRTALRAARCSVRRDAGTHERPPPPPPCGSPSCAPRTRGHVAPSRSEAAGRGDEGTRLLGDGLRALLLQLRLPE